MLTELLGLATCNYLSRGVVPYLVRDSHHAVAAYRYPMTGTFLGFPVILEYRIRQINPPDEPDVIYSRLPVAASVIGRNRVGVWSFLVIRPRYPQKKEP